jgi:hypothetical protein
MANVLMVNAHVMLITPDNGVKKDGVEIAALIRERVTQVLNVSVMKDTEVLIVAYLYAQTTVLLKMGNALQLAVYVNLGIWVMIVRLNHAQKIVITMGNVTLLLVNAIVMMDFLETAVKRKNVRTIAMGMEHAKKENVYVRMVMKVEVVNIVIYLFNV